MKKEKQELTPRIRRQIEIISKYYDIDYENRIITLELHYESVDELFESDFVGKGIPSFKEDILKRISGILESFPEEFTANLKLSIDDYKGMDPKKITESLKDSLELFNYHVHHEKSYRWVEAVILALISVAILFVRKFALDNKIIDDSVLLTEMLDITAWVFLWQGVTVLFLGQDTLNDINFKLISKLNTVSLLDKNKNIVNSINRAEIEKDWVQISKKEKVSRKMLIIAGAVSLATGITNISGILQYAFVPELYSTPILIITLVVAILGVLIAIFGGIGAISLFREKGPFKKAVPATAFIYLVVDVALVSVMVLSMVVSNISIKEIIAAIVALIISFGASILYFVSYLMLRRTKKMDNLKYKK